MDTINTLSSNQNKSSNSVSHITKNEKSRFTDNTDVQQVNAVLNPAPPPLPGVFVFDRPGQQAKASNVDSNFNLSSKTCERSQNLNKSSASIYSEQFGKERYDNVGTHNEMHSNSSIFQSSSHNLYPPVQPEEKGFKPLEPTVSCDIDSMLPPDVGSVYQSLEPVSVNIYEDSIHSPETKVYQQLQLVSPNHFRLEEEKITEPKLYHELGPMSYPRSMLPKEELKKYEQLNAIPAAEESPRGNKTFQELKPVSQCYNPPQYANSKLYQQLRQPLNKEKRPKYLEEVKMFHQLRPTTVIDFEQARHQQPVQQRYSNTPERVSSQVLDNSYPHPQIGNKNNYKLHHKNQNVIINKSGSLISKPPINDGKKGLPIISLDKSPNETQQRGFKEDKPKVYLELRNPSIRQPVPESETFQNVESVVHSQYSITPPKYENIKTCTSQTPSQSQISPHKVDQTISFKLPGPYEFKLPQQNSPNKYKLPKILGPNEYGPPELRLHTLEKGPVASNGHSFGAQNTSASMLIAASSSNYGKSSLITVKNKIPLSLPRTPLCYGDPGVSSKSNYYPDTNSFASEVEANVSQSNSYFGKQSVCNTTVSNVSSYSVPTTSHSKLRDELLKSNIVHHKKQLIFKDEEAVKKYTCQDNLQFKNEKDPEPLFMQTGSNKLDSSLKAETLSNCDNGRNQNNVLSYKAQAFTENKTVCTKDFENKEMAISERCYSNKVNSLNRPKDFENKEMAISERCYSNKVDSLNRPISNVKRQSDELCTKDDNNQMFVGSVELKEANIFKDTTYIKPGSAIKELESPQYNKTIKTVDKETEEENYAENIGTTIEPPPGFGEENKQKDVLDRLDILENKPVDSEGNITKSVPVIEKGHTNYMKENCSNTINISSADSTVIKSTEQCKTEDISSADSTVIKSTEQCNTKEFSSGVDVVSDEKILNKEDQIVKNELVSTDSNSKAENCLITEIKEESSDQKLETPKLAHENGAVEVIKVKRKYTKRKFVDPAKGVERRELTKRKASRALKEIIKLQKRKYTKRNSIKTPKLDRVSEFDGETIDGSIKENVVCKVEGLKIEAVIKDSEENLNDEKSIKEQEMVPRKKRKYTRRLGKKKDEGTQSNSTERVKRKYTKRKKVNVQVDEQFAPNVDSVPSTSKPAVKCESDAPLKVKRKYTKRKKIEDVGKQVAPKEDSVPSTSKPTVKYEYIDPLEEGLISEDEGEVLFLGFDMPDEEDETILGFDLSPDQDPINNLLSHLEESDCVTVDCDPRSLLQAPSNTTSCPQCHKSFESHIDLVTHMQWHAATQSPHTHSYVCTVCLRGFPTQFQLDKHTKWTHEGGKKHKCPVCLKMFTTSTYVKKHVETVHKEEVPKILTFYCGDCSETFTSEAKLKEHETKRHKRTLHQCEKCLKHFLKFSNLQRHKRTHEGESEGQGQTFPCAYCNQKFSTKDSLHAHWSVHSDRKAYTCDICNSKFTALNSLKRHRILHAGEKLFRCEICQRSFSLLSSLKTHLLIHTGARRFECKLCGKAFNRRDVLNAHQWVHTGEKKFQCDICMQKFRWRHAVRSHKLIYHSTEKPYACKVCGKRFSHPDSFKKHGEVHAEKLFYCQICLKAFSRPSTLKAHILIHTDLKPFFCDKCNKGFRSKSHLRNHFLVHTKEKPWLCKFCNKTYKDRTQLRRHKRVVHCKAFYKKIIPGLPDDFKTDDKFEMLEEAAEAVYSSQDSFKESDPDPSEHFISLPFESDIPKVEENIVPPSVF